MNSSFLQFGHLRIPIYGIFAAVGLMAALGLSQRTARYAHLAPEALWNAGVTAIVSAFLISRLLLVAFNFHSFLEYPLLILALPSLTTTGILLTSIFMLAYIRWRRLPLLPLFDAAAPCGALLWAFLTLGSVFDGTRDGMPTHLPWGIRDSIAASGRVHPVEVYTLVAASLIAVASHRIIHSTSALGSTFAIASIASGLAIFFIDFFRLPSEFLEHSPIDPSQIGGLAMILAGATILIRRSPSPQTPPDL